MLISFIYAIVSMIVVLGVMIVVHEFGHFAAAKMFGVRVETFSIGFGKRLIGFKHGETDYRISALPLGGYVKMSGENPMDSHTGDAGEFSAHPRWQRLVIAVAGPTMNILLAIGLLTAVFMFHYEKPYYIDQPAVIGGIVQNSPVEKAGLQIGDRIVKLDGIQNPTWEDIYVRTAISPNQAVAVTVKRGSETIDRQLTPESFGADQIGEAGWTPDQPNIITEIEPDMPAFKAGLRLGDEITAVNGVAVRSTAAMSRLLQQTKDKPAEFTYLRNGVTSKVTVAPAMSEREGQKAYRIGVLCLPVHVYRLNFSEALANSVATNRSNSMIVLEIVKRLFRGRAKISQMSGPIEIARESGRMARQDGWLPLMTFMALISLQLGIFNLFPFPILDGGLIMMLLVEAVMRRDISINVKERIYQAAFVCLIVFAGIVIFNDVLKMLPGLTHHVQ